jgi:hypothetical protein
MANQVLRTMALPKPMAGGGVRAHETGPTRDRPGELSLIGTQNTVVFSRRAPFRYRRQRNVINRQVSVPAWRYRETMIYENMVMLTAAIQEDYS